PSAALPFPRPAPSLPRRSLVRAAGRDLAPHPPLRPPGLFRHRSDERPTLAAAHLGRGARALRRRGADAGGPDPAALAAASLGHRPVRRHAGRRGAAASHAPYPLALGVGAVARAAGGESAALGHRPASRERAGVVLPAPQTAWRAAVAVVGG